MYFDHNATTFLSQKAIEAMNALGNAPLNPSSVHADGRKARKLLEDARKTILKSLNVTNFHKFRVIFTCSGTEANNLALLGIKDHGIIVSKIEHPSIFKIAQSLGNAKFVNVSKEGEIDLEHLKRQLAETPGAKIVSIMMANNETGVIQDISEIAKICRDHGAIFHTDASQAFGKIKVNLEELGVDMMTISAHKSGGPVGAACLIVKEGITISSIIKGGGQEKGSRAGTENVRAIVGFAAIAEEIPMRLEKMQEIKILKDVVESEILTKVPNAEIFSKNAKNRLPNTICLSMPNVKNETQLMNFDIAQISISAGSACSSGTLKNSHVLEAMGVSESESSCTVRFSLGIENTKEEVASFIKKWLEIQANIKEL